jgi:hypothetical protein
VAQLYFGISPDDRSDLVGSHNPERLEKRADCELAN